jgi:hypothetical protein
LKYGDERADWLCKLVCDTVAFAIALRLVRQSLGLNQTRM